MKTVGIIGATTAPLVYFANELHKHHPFELLIIEEADPKPQNVSVTTQPNEHSFYLKYAGKILRYLLFKLDQKSKAKAKINATENEALACMKWFGETSPELNPDIPYMVVKNINDPEVVARLSEIKPDLILDHGSSLVKPEVLNTAKLALNLHWGLSPYYRGVNCTNKALQNWDPYNIGVTIHKLAVQIDGGDILGQARAVISPDEDVHYIPYQLTHLGVEILKTAVNMIKNNEPFYFQQQDFNAGFLVRGLHWNENMNAFSESLDKTTLEIMLRKPSRGPAPIIVLE